MIKKPSTKKVSLSLSLKWPLNYPLPVFPSISHTYNEWQKSIICTKNRNINVDVTDHCLVSNLQKNEITGIQKRSIWSFVIAGWWFVIVCWSFVIVCCGLWWFVVVACFSNYEVYEASILFGKQIHVSDQSSWYQKVISDLIQLHGTITSCE